LPTEITPHVTSLHVDLSWFPQPYPPNVFLIRDGNEAAIIDAGFSDDESFNKRMEVLGDLGETKLKYIIITHHHYDHSSGAHRLREATGAQIVVHKDEETLLLNPDEGSGDVEIPEDQKEAREQADDIVGVHGLSARTKGLAAPRATTARMPAATPRASASASCLRPSNTAPAASATSQACLPVRSIPCSANQ